ncbi:hypothetical protein FD754_017154 [Muntiacus muntjak]|uniref:RNA polymerase II subunit A C-terminal domain phosphatase SSU72 n=1 Tax=Muntiacus muntjak TaxID=9888 RepID=A0A5N3VSW7_MUNMU|nr:hypothetical protein FD754_017154 [Muntiacus muntjak]
MAMVCMSNMNRSMEAQSILEKKGFNVRSFGVGSCVTLPGLAPSPWSMISPPHISRYARTFSSKTRYAIAACTAPFDVIFTCAERVYKMVVKDLCDREQKTGQPVHVINLDIKDTLKAVSLGASIICELCQGLQQADDTQSSLMTRKAKEFLHTVCFY